MNFAFIDQSAIIMIRFDADVLIACSAYLGKRDLLGFIDRDGIACSRGIGFCVIVNVEDLARRLIDLVVIFAIGSIEFDLIDRSAIVAIFFRFDEGGVCGIDTGIGQRNRFRVFQRDPRICCRDIVRACGRCSTR